MAEIKITDLINYPTILSASTDVLPIVDVTNNVTKKITVSNLVSGITGAGLTSVGLNVPNTFLVSPNPLTANGAITLSWGSGQIPLPNLAIGTPTVATFLRGDGTWSLPTLSLITNVLSGTGLTLAGSITAGVREFSVASNVISTFPVGTQVSFNNDPNGFAIYTVSGVPLFASGVTNVPIAVGPILTVTTGLTINTVTQTVSTFNTIQAGTGITITNNNGVLTINRT